jgi:hypothetical protein
LFECGGIRPALLHLEDGEQKLYGGRQFLPAKCWVSLPYYVMKTKKDCYDFGDKKICKVCGCTDGSCDCETVEEHKKKEKVT